MPQKKHLTARQLKFIDELVAREPQLTPTEAAIKAGYSANQASQMASRLQSPKLFPLVVEALEKRRSEYQRKYAATKGSHLKQLDRLRELAIDKGQMGPAIMAEFRRGQVGGLYIEQKIQLSGSIDSLSRIEVLKRIEEIKQRHPKILTNIEVEEIKKEAKGEEIKTPQLPMKLPENKDKDKEELLVKTDKKLVDKG